VQYASGDAIAAPTRAQLRRWAAAACEHPLQAVLRFVDDEEGAALNHRHRGKDKPTNVLTFPYEGPPQVSGDIAICLPLAAREAATLGRPLAAHLAHLVVHAMLHLQGYDHETDEQQAKRMEMREREILQRFGVADPYQ